MIFRNYNDYEIINLIKEGQEDAFSFLVDKYSYLIAKKIKSFNLTDEFDDCFQEGLMTLYRSAIKFDDTYQRTFTRYFEQNFVNFLITYKKKLNRLKIYKVEKIPVLETYLVTESPKINYLDQEICRALDTLSKYEKQVFQMRIVERKTIKQCAKTLNCDEKKVHNAMSRIRNKIKLHLMT